MSIDDALRATTQEEPPVTVPRSREELLAELDTLFRDLGRNDYVRRVKVAELQQLDADSARLAQRALVLNNEAAGIEPPATP